MNITEIIKCDSELEDVLVWKHPSEDFNNNSKLIVGPAQKAVFVLNGEGHVFDSGEYSLETGNIPFIRKIQNFTHGGVSTFHCQVYYINATIALNINWGTSSQFDVIDPQFKIPYRVGASGSMGIQVNDPLAFIIKIVGHQQNVTAEYITTKFRDLVSTRVKTYLSKAMSEISLFSITQYLDDLSQALMMKIREDMEPYGVYLDSFYMPNIMIPEEDKSTIYRVMNKMYEQNQLGYNWTDEQISDIMKKYAVNPGSKDNIGGMVAQTPMALAFGQMFAQNSMPFLSGSFSNPPLAFGERKVQDKPAESPIQEDKPNILKPKAQTENTAEKADDPIERMSWDLERLKKMVESGLMTQDDYDAKKKEWLSRI